MIPLMLNFSAQQTGTKYRTHTSLHTITNDEDDLLRRCSEDTDCQMGKITLSHSLLQRVSLKDYADTAVSDRTCKTLCKDDAKR